MAVRISEKNRREMSPERDFPTAPEVQQRYCILSSPRSGSTLLGRLLYETGLAGDPQEYFNPPLLAIERERSGNSQLDLNGFLKIMESRRTSPNGVFGMKLHFSQMLYAFRSNQVNQGMLRMLKKFNQLIWIRRRDRLGQGISQAVALKTQVWSSEDNSDVTISAQDLHPFQCLNALTVVCKDDRGWEQVITSANLPVLEIWYEDLVTNYQHEAARVIDYLGLKDSVSTIPEPPLKRQANEVNEELRDRVLCYLGITKED